MEQSLDQITKPLANGIKQYHTTIVFVVLAILVGLAVFQLSMIVGLSGQEGVDGYAPVSKANANFDQKTIDRIDGLRTATQAEEQLKFPTRQSPFVE